MSWRLFVTEQALLLLLPLLLLIVVVVAASAVVVLVDCFIIYLNFERSLNSHRGLSFVSVLRPHVC